MMHNLSDDNLTPEEEALYARLPRTGAIDQLAEERTVALLRSRGLLLRPLRVHRRRAVAIIASIAAALVLFTSGVAFGQRLSTRAALSVSPATQVQEAGSAYVKAVVRLSESQPDSLPSTVVAGLQAGTATLHAAAASLARIDPKDPEVQRLRTVLEFANHVPGSDTNVANGHLVVWF